MLTLTEFLLARLDEQRTECDGTGEYSGCWRLSEFAERAAVAMRRIVEDATNQHTSGPELDWVVSVLAAVYADHDDYREEWKP